jgi:hypothetical protein
MWNIQSGEIKKMCKITYQICSTQTKYMKDINHCGMGTYITNNTVIYSNLKTSNLKLRTGHSCNIQSVTAATEYHLPVFSRLNKCAMK